MYLKMKMIRQLFLAVSVAVIGNCSHVAAQTYYQLERTVWEHLWDNNMHRDFLVFVSENKSISYSYELDEFEFLNYRIHNDTIIMTTYNNLNNEFAERNTDSITYYYVNKNDHLLLLMSVFHYEDGQSRELFPEEHYILYKKEY